MQCKMAAMKFEHLVQINDPGNPLMEFLVRDQLWSGLWHRVENPVVFLPGLESCQILEAWEGGLLRVLDFGGARIQDRVSFVLNQWVRFDIEAGENHPGGSLVINIEEPQPDCLFLRFTYETTLEENAEDVAYSEYVKSAYQDSDIETVRVIRAFLAQGSVW